MTEQIQIVHSSCHNHPKRDGMKNISNITPNTGHAPALRGNPAYGLDVPGTGYRSLPAFPEVGCTCLT